MLFALGLPVTDKGLLVAGLDDEDYGNQVGKPPGQTSVMTYPEALRLAQQVSLGSTLSTSHQRAREPVRPTSGHPCSPSASNAHGEPGCSPNKIILHPRATRMENQDAVQIK